MAYRIQNTDALLKTAWESELWDEMQEQDIFTGLTGTYSESNKLMADGIIQRVNLDAGTNSKTMGMVLELNGAGRQGAGLNLVGFTESLATRKFTVYANDVRHGVDSEQYGLYAHRNSAYNLMERINPLLGKWLKARRGKHIRQSVLQKFSDNLVTSPTSLTVGWNRHMLVKNVAQSSQPTYDSTLASYTANINTALAAAGTTSAAVLDTTFLTNLEYYATVIWKLMPLDNGTYIVTIPARQATYLKDFANTEGISSFQRTTLSEEIAKKSWQQVLGQFGRLVLVVDDRSPIINRNSATGVLTAAYRDVGTTDDRSAYTNSGNNTVWDVGMIFGKSAVTEAIAMKPRYDDDITDFNRLRSIGVSTTYGYQVTEFDSDSASSTTRIGQNCGCFLAYSSTLTV